MFDWVPCCRSRRAVQYALTLVRAMQTSSPVSAARTSRRYIFVWNVRGALVDDMVRAVAGNTGACGDVPLGGQRIPHRPRGARRFSLNQGKLLRMGRSRWCASGMCARQCGRTRFGFRDLAWVHVCFNGDFSIAVGGAQECVQQARGTVGTKRYVLPVRTENTERTRASVREAG